MHASIVINKRLKKVLLIKDDKNVEVGSPIIDGAIVEGLLLDLAASEWDTAILLPTEDFVKEINGLSFSIKKEDVWKETDETFYDKIRGQRIVRGYGTKQSREMAT